MRIESFKNSLAARALARVQHMQGLNAAVGTSYEYVWPVNAAYGFLGAAATLYIGSSDALDTAVTVTVEGLDSNWNFQIVEIALDGTDPQADQVAVVSTGNTETWLRVNRAYVSGGTAAVGNIHIANEVPGTWGAGGVPGTLANTISYISIADQESKQAIYSTSASEQAYAFLLDMTNNTADDTTFRVRIRPFGGVFAIKYESPAVNAATLIKEWFLSINAKPRSDIIVEALATAAADVSVDLEIVRD